MRKNINVTYSHMRKKINSMGIIVMPVHQSVHHSFCFLNCSPEVENIPEIMEERRAERLSFHLVSNEGLGYHDCNFNYL